MERRSKLGSKEIIRQKGEEESRKEGKIERNCFVMFCSYPYAMCIDLTIL